MLFLRAVHLYIYIYIIRREKKENVEETKFYNELNG